MDISVERRALLVVAGLPGSGKSTLLRRTHASTPIAVLDTDHVRAWLARIFSTRVPYSYYRPLVHLLHSLRVLGVLVFSARPVVVHDPATGAGTRALFAIAGSITGRPCHLLWVDCTPAEALAGQIARGRVLLKWSFARHLRRAPAVCTRLRAGHTPQGWRSATVVDRLTVTDGLYLTVTEAVRN
jgi:hypothetical protein